MGTSKRSHEAMSEIKFMGKAVQRPVSTSCRGLTLIGYSVSVAALYEEETRQRRSGQTRRRADVGHVGGRGGCRIGSDQRTRQRCPRRTACLFGAALSTR